ncbi:MAG: ABC transporter ATP-binding protein [Acidobacteriota bacterium]|nr:MAG: ABC transporter ATP-binding protein [Acidobacteriota bacterium]
MGSHRVEVLEEISFRLEKGEALAITGPSGSGKSTLLHCLGTLTPPSSGTIEIEGRNPFLLEEQELARFRNNVVGFVFQDHHLLPQYSVLENVMLPALAFPSKGQGLEGRARKLLETVGLSHRLDHRPALLSGGERQRAAVARALINSPQLLLCDEPTGNLDQKNAGTIADLLFELHEEENAILIVVTHSQELAHRFSRHFAIREGRLFDEA